MALRSKIRLVIVAAVLAAIAIIAAVVTVTNSTQGQFKMNATPNSEGGKDLTLNIEEGLNVQAKP